MSKIITEYKIACRILYNLHDDCNTFIKDFEQDVKILIDKGFQPIGNIIAVKFERDLVFFQSMVKYKQESETNLFKEVFDKNDKAFDKANEAFDKIFDKNDKAFDKVHEAFHKAFKGMPDGSD